MKRLIKQAVLGIVVAATVAAVATPAEARRYGRYYRHHDRGDLALGAGLIGLAAGVALASDRGYGYGYYDRPYYGGGYYRPHYRPYRGYWRPHCFMRRSWDYWGRPVRVRVCR